ncbi:MAG: DUF5055 domain-containing protein, partial [Bacteroidaceae bacterium]|nr:DUF5055 domain-containing protein [Bacteroidaceae bacterium]
MAGKQIKLEYNDKSYVLEYTRKTVQSMERSGFLIEEVSTKPVSTLPRLFAGAFLAHHPFVKEEVVNNIFNSLPNKPELLETLAAMYNEPIASMLETSEESQGNA